MIILVPYFLLSHSDLRYEFLIKTYIKLKMDLYIVRYGAEHFRSTESLTSLYRAFHKQWTDFDRLHV